MNAQEYEIIEAIENDSEDDEDEEEEGVYVDALQISKLCLGKEEIQTQPDGQYSNALPSTVGQAPLLAPGHEKITLHEGADEDEEDEQLFQTHDRLGQNPLDVQILLPQITASHPSPLVPWQDLTIEYIWQSPRPLPTSTPYMITAYDAWTIEPASFSPPPPSPTTFSLCGIDDDFTRLVGYNLVSQLTRREASKGTITLKTPIIAGEWVVNEYILVECVWKHVGRSPVFRTVDAKIRIQGTVEREDERAVVVAVKVFRQEMKRKSDHIVVVRRQDFPEDQVYLKAEERERHLEEDYIEVYLDHWLNGKVAAVKLQKRIKKEGEEKKGEEWILMYVTEDFQDINKEKRKKILGRSPPFLVPFLKS